MRELVEVIAKALVDYPNEVAVTETENEKSIVIELRVAQADMGKVIGKQGRIAKAIRSVVKAAAAKNDKKVIGSIGLHYSRVNEDANYGNFKIKEIGYVLSKTYWGQGLMPEAVNAVIEYCFNVLGLDALTVGHFVDNLQSKRVIEKNGFTYISQGEFIAKGFNKTFLESHYIFFNNNSQN